MAKRLNTIERDKIDAKIASGEERDERTWWFIKHVNRLSRGYDMPEVIRLAHVSSCPQYMEKVQQRAFEELRTMLED